MSISNYSLISHLLEFQRGGDGPVAPTHGSPIYFMPINRYELYIPIYPLLNFLFRRRFHEIRSNVDGGCTAGEGRG